MSTKSDEAQTCDLGGDDVIHLGPTVGGARAAIRHTKGHKLRAGLLYPLEHGRPVPLGVELMSLTSREQGGYTVESHGRLGNGPAKVSSSKYRRGWGKVFGSKQNKALLN